VVLNYHLVFGRYCTKILWFNSYQYHIYSMCCAFCIEA